MKSILKDVRQYIRIRRTWHDDDRTQPAGPRPEPASEDPNAEMRRLIAITMLFG